MPSEVNGGKLLYIYLLMSNIDKFLNSEATELLSDQEMVFLDGGKSDNSSGESSDINALADCGVVNNCHGGNCASGCGGSHEISKQ